MYRKKLGFKEESDLLFIVKYKHDIFNECKLFVYDDSILGPDFKNYIMPVISDDLVFAECRFQEFYLLMLGRIKNEYAVYEVFDKNKIIDVDYRGKYE